MVWLGTQTELTNAHAVNSKDIIDKFKDKKGKGAKKVRMSIAEKEHIWRISKKWIDDDIEEEVEVREVSSMSSDPEPPKEPLQEPPQQEEMVPKRLYDALMEKYNGKVKDIDELLEKYEKLKVELDGKNEYIEELLRRLKDQEGHYEGELGARDSKIEELLARIKELESRPVKVKDTSADDQLREAIR